jgi:hypothetical protein
MLDNTEVSQASIYRNLWIEAEASACKLKYELQHARLKFETANGLNDTVKGTPSLHKCKHFQDSWDIFRRMGNDCDVPQSITKITETQLTLSYRCHKHQVLTKTLDSKIILMLNTLATKIKWIPKINDEGGEGLIIPEMFTFVDNFEC